MTDTPGDFGGWLLIDDATEIVLDPHGLRGYSAVTAVNSDGTETLWLIHRPQLGVPGACTRHHYDPPEHEELGVLPDHIHDRLDHRKGSENPMSHTQQPGTPARVNDRARALEAVQLRRDGLSLKEIAERLGYSGHPSVSRAIRRCLDRTESETAAEYREIIGARLENIYALIMTI
ncbi:MAG: hypothetical protein QM581_00490 [Pseudomonas sp.]